jgi:hypothetical protein
LGSSIFGDCSRTCEWSGAAGRFDSGAGSSTRGFVTGANPILCSAACGAVCSANGCSAGWASGPCGATGFAYIRAASTRARCNAGCASEPRCAAGTAHVRTASASAACCGAGRSINSGRASAGTGGCEVGNLIRVDWHSGRSAACSVSNADDQARAGQFVIEASGSGSSGISRTARWASQN